MCELCTGEFQQVGTLEVARAAFMAERAEPFGRLHVVVEDANVDDETIRWCMRNEPLDESEKTLCNALLALTEDERISSLAKAAHLWGCDPIPRHEA